MKILFVNDDGYDAIGLNTLYQEFAPHHKTFMSAPLTHKSAFSHAINYWGDLEIVALNDAVTGFAVDSTPADCTRAAIHGLLAKENPFDLVLSGINYGVNAAQDVFYSGTVGAAREGIFCGVFSLALSQVVPPKSEWAESLDQFSLSAANTRKIVAALPKEIFSFKDIILNINFPLTLNPKGIKVCGLGKHSYRFKVVEKEIQGTPHITFRHTESEIQHIPDTDLVALHDGYIAISALYNGVVVHEEAQKVIKVLEDLPVLQG